MKDFDWIDELQKAMIKGYRVGKRYSLEKTDYRATFPTKEEAFKDFLAFYEEEKLKHGDLKFTEDKECFYKVGYFCVRIYTF